MCLINVLLEQLNQVQLENERLYAQLRIRQIIPTQVDKDVISSARINTGIQW